MAEQNTEPPPQRGTLVFEPWDFEALAEGRARSPEYNDRRLAARRRLLALGKSFVPRAKAAGVLLEARTSIHNPHAFNGGAVKRLWTYLVRAKGEKSKLRKVLGRDLAKDLDSAYRNAYLYVALEPTGFEVGLRIHQDAWYDGQNLAKRVKAEGPAAWRAILNELGGYQLRLHDWKGEWRCGALTPETLDEFLRFWTPGEHQLVVDRRYPLPVGLEERARVLSEEDWPARLTAELEGLLPLYRFAAWSDESSFLFG